MASVTRTHTFQDQAILTADQLNNEFDNLLNSLGLTNSDIAAGAAIDYSKLDLIGSIVDADISDSAAITASKISGVAAVLDGTQSFTGVNTFTKVVNTIVTATDGSTITFDLSTGNIQQVTLGGNRTLALSNVSVGQAFVIRLIQDGSGSRTVTWFSTIKWPRAVIPILTTTAGETDVFGFICTSTGNYDGYIVGQNL